MARFSVYQKSVGATLCSLLGAGLIVKGVTLVIVEKSIVAGIIIVVIGVGLQFAASAINERVEFKALKKQIQMRGLEMEIVNSVPFALQVYQSMPTKAMQHYIGMLNQQAGYAILTEKAKQKNKACR